MHLLPRLLLTVPFLLSACSSDPTAPDPEPDPTARVTWHQDVAPVIHEHCVGCHTPGGIAPFTLEGYDDVADVAEYLLVKVESGEMPPWHAVGDEDCEPRYAWEHDARVPDEQIQILRDWIAGGKHEGDPATAAPLPERQADELADTTHSLAPIAEYTTSGYVDQQVCFVLDPELTTAQWMTGVQFHPGNLEVVHHAVLLAIPPDQADTIRARGGDDGTFDCFGAVGFEGSYNLGVWVPGARPFETPGQSGIPMAPGTIMVMNIHYHPTGFMHEADLTTVDLRLSPTQPERTFFMTAVGNSQDPAILQAGPNDRAGAEFRIPANVADHIETMRFPIETEDARRLPMTAMFPHMHYVGTKMKVTITRANPAPGEPETECLMNIPAWDFDWQRTYFYDVDPDDLPTVGDGDVIEIECEYDNTLANPFVHRMLLDEGLEEPIDVMLGEETTDEMCLIGVGIIL